jgi:hypothetical protein
MGDILSLAIAKLASSTDTPGSDTRTTSTGPISSSDAY